MQTAKAKRDADVRKPALARAEILDKATRARFEAELSAALKRRPPSEGKLAGALRVLAPLSPALRAAMAAAVQLLLKRGTLQRELYASLLRSLAELEDKSVPALLRAALTGDDAGGTTALVSACFTDERELTPLLAKLAASRQSHLAFGAELARVARGESNGAHLTSLAPMIKESHRISMCVELFAPLVRRRPVPVHVGPALTVLRGAERHLGRWLVMGEVATRAGDPTPLEEARGKSDVGPTSARAAWSLVRWALEQTKARAAGAPEVPAPTTRPTLELVARLSDRPSADRDTTFLFRMAAARAVVARPMLETFAKPQLPLADEVGLRAALFLARDHGREDLLEALRDAAATAKREELRGLAAAALWDAAGGKDPVWRARAREVADDLVASRCVGNVAWGALIRAADRARSAEAGDGDAEVARAERRSAGPLLVTEASVRWLQWGWLE